MIRAEEALIDSTGHPESARSPVNNIDGVRDSVGHSPRRIWFQSRFLLKTFFSPNV
jgi:hypothetical protein